MRTVRQPDGSRSTRDFFHGDGVRQISQAGAAVIRADREPEQAEFARLPPQVPGKPVAAIDFIGARRDALRGEAARLIAHRIDHFPEAEGELSVCRIGHFDRFPHCHGIRIVG